MASMSHLFLVTIGISYLVNQTAAVNGGPEDALALVQQRAHLDSQSSSLAAILEESFHANPNGHDDIIDKVVGKVGEERLQKFWERMIELGSSSNLSRPLRGLLLVQESSKILGAQSGPLDWIWDTRIYKYLMNGKSEGSACWVTRFSFLADIGDLTVSIAYPVGKSCKKPALCVASAFDILRALVYTMREIAAGRFSYCAGSISTKILCGASFSGIVGELSGVVHSSVSLSYKCNKNTYDIGDVNSKMLGVNARKFMCTWDITRGSAYFIVALYRTIWFFLLRKTVDEQVVDDQNTVKRTRGMEEIGQSASAYGLMALGGFAWLTNAIIAGVSNCPDDSGSSGSMVSACSKESAELTAYTFQLMAYIQNFRDYCLDSQEKNAGREEAGNEEAFRNQVNGNWDLILEKVREKLKELNPNDGVEDEVRLKEDEVRYFIENMYLPQARASEVLGDVLRKSIISPPSRPSMSPFEMDEMMNEMAQTLQVGNVPQNRQRLSVLRPRLSMANHNSNSKSKSLSVPSFKGKNIDRLSVVQGVPESDVRISEEISPLKSTAGIVIKKPLPPESPNPGNVLEIPVIKKSLPESPNPGNVLKIPVTIPKVMDESNLNQEPMVTNKLAPEPLSPTSNSKTKTIGGFAVRDDKLTDMLKPGSTVVENQEPNTQIVDNSDPKFPESHL